MAQYCDVDDCRLKGKPVHRLTFQGGKWRGEDCGCARRYRIRSTHNPFELTLNHVSDEFGNYVKVSSIRQLEAAQTRYGFEHVVLNYDGQNANDPPQQRKIGVADIHKQKFGRR